ncbi:MAG: NAD(+) diphosphatase [Treponema sp.]|nr:NAD(+) diphosphatase [Treponema sp.]
MEKKAFFFQGDGLLVPQNTSDSQITEELPLELSKEFEDTQVFTVPAVDGSPPSAITGVSVPPEAVLPVNWKRIPVRRLLSMFSAAGKEGVKLSKIMRACHISGWRQESRFCGSCGAENNDVPGGEHRLCPKCGRMEFPRICPAVIVIITDKDNRILLAHNKRFKQGVYSHISGFNEAGESLEETAAREIREEINIEVENIEYAASQPWPFPNSLMIGFRARYLSGTIHPDGEEIEAAAWFTKDNLPELPTEGSLSRSLINDWLAEN